MCINVDLGEKWFYVVPFEIQGTFHKNAPFEIKVHYLN